MTNVIQILCYKKIVQILSSFLNVTKFKLEKNNAVYL